MVGACVVVVGRGRARRGCRRRSRRGAARAATRPPRAASFRRNVHGGAGQRRARAGSRREVERPRDEHDDESLDPSHLRCVGATPRSHCRARAARAVGRRDGRSRSGARAPPGRQRRAEPTGADRHAHGDRHRDRRRRRAAPAAAGSGTGGPARRHRAGRQGARRHERPAAVRARASSTSRAARTTKSRSRSRTPISPSSCASSASSRASASSSAARSATSKPSIYSPQKVTVAEAYQAFLSILETNGLTVVPHGRFLKIVETRRHRDAGDARSYGAGQAAPAEDRYVTRMLPPAARAAPTRSRTSSGTSSRRTATSPSTARATCSSSPTPARTSGA